MPSKKYYLIIGNDLHFGAFQCSSSSIDNLGRIALIFQRHPVADVWNNTDLRYQARELGNMIPVCIRNLFVP